MAYGDLQNDGSLDIVVNNLTLLRTCWSTVAKRVTGSR